MRRLTIGPSLRTWACAGFLAAAGGAAHAADLKLPPAPVLAPVAEDFGGWYLRGDVGGGWGSVSSKSSTFVEGFDVPGFSADSRSVTGSFLIGGGVGYQFNSWLRADVTGEYRNPQGYRAGESYDGAACVNGRCGDAYYGKIQSPAMVLVNGYVDLGNWSGFTPYVGAGIGTAYTRFGPIQDFGTDLAAAGYGYAAAKSNWQFAWAVMAGIGYAISPNLVLDLGYRYVGYGTHNSSSIVCQGAPACGYEVQKVGLASQDIRLGLRWVFGAAPPPPPPPAPPLVRKY